MIEPLPTRSTVAAVIFVVEHRLVRGGLSKIQKALFEGSAYMSLGLC